MLLFSFVNATLCACFALIYCLIGYKKNGAIFFLLFCISYTICKAIPLIIAEQTLMLDRVLWVVMFGCMCILTVAKDLGRKKSYILAGIVLGCEIIAVALVATMSLPGNALISASVHVLNAIVFGIMVYAKYKDKEIRGYGGDCHDKP